MPLPYTLGENICRWYGISRPKAVPEARSAEAYQGWKILLTRWSKVTGPFHSVDNFRVTEPHLSRV